MSPSRPLLLAGVAAVLVCLASAGGFINAGTPADVPKAFDCTARKLAWEYGQHLLPGRGEFRTLFDALQLQACGLTPPVTFDKWRPPVVEAPPVGGPTIFADASKGSDATGDGSLARPFASLARAVRAAAGAKDATVLLRDGTYYTDTIHIGPEHSGLTIQNFHGEHAVVSGGVPFTVPKSAWAAADHVAPGTLRADLSGVVGLDEGVPGLRVDGRRAVRARYPNGRPELSGLWYVSDDASGMGHGGYTHGWVANGSVSWMPPRPKPKPTNVVVTAKEWPGVEWPMQEDGGSKWTGEGAWGEYHVGMGGTCDDLDPPYGYWCSSDPPRGIMPHQSPSGLKWDAKSLPNAPRYSDPTGAVVHAWRGKGRWYTWQFEVASADPAARTLTFSPRSGMQGGEGEVTGSEWYIENVKEECDDADEYYFDAKERALYFHFNGTEGPTGEEQFVATSARVIFNVTGSLKRPVTGFSLRGVEVRDARSTFLEPHGMPSGGDWALQRSGAVHLENTEGAAVDRCHVTLVDGNGIFLSGYNVNATVEGSELSWIGDTAVAAWGHTGQCLDAACTRTVPYKVGPDGRGGEQPRRTTVRGNLVRELGLMQKQSSFWFQAIASETRIVGNVHFNGPRAGLNFNDGFGGGDEVAHNLLLNCVRESGDHGPINSWDRVPYITTLGTGKPSIIPLYREIHHNFIFGTYSSQEGVDTDDGSSYYHTHHNVMVYGANGLKSDFGGHHNKHVANLYAYVINCIGTDEGNNDQFVNNTCISRTDDAGYTSTCRGHKKKGKKPKPPAAAGAGPGAAGAAPAAAGRGPLGGGGIAVCVTPCKPKSHMKVRGNAVFNRLGKLTLCKKPFHTWVKEGKDPGSTLGKWPADAEVAGWARQLLGLPGGGGGVPQLPTGEGSSEGALDT